MNYQDQEMYYQDQDQIGQDQEMNYQDENQIYQEQEMIGQGMVEGKQGYRLSSFAS